MEARATLPPARAAAPARAARRARAVRAAEGAATDNPRRDPQAAAPFYLQWHVTGKCNLACGHCYRTGAAGDPSLEELRTAFSRFRELRAVLPHARTRVQVTGGEPLLCSHLFALLEWIADAGYEIRLLSNGTLVTPEVARRLRDIGCSSVQVSLDGGKETHERMRGARTYQAALDGAAILRAEGIPVTFAMTLSSATVEGLPELLEAAARCADRVGFHRLVPCGRGKELEAEVLAPEELRRAFATVWKAREAFPGLRFSLRDPLWRAFVGGPIAGCSTGGCSIACGGICIEADGSVYPCRRLPLVAGNALRDDLRMLWEGELFSRLRDRRALEGSCARCVYLYACGGCRAVAYAVSGSAYAADPQCFRRPGPLERPLREIVRVAARHAAGEPSKAGGG